jgi:hypothetical protein
MYCPHCNYLLFNLPRPICPECGRAFRVTDYRFEPETVEYLCPACHAPIHDLSVDFGYGDPRSTCRSCGADLNWETLTVRPLRRDVTGVLRDPKLEAYEPVTFRSWQSWWRRTMSLQQHFFTSGAQRPTDEAIWFASMTGFVTAFLGGILGTAIFLMLGIAHGDVEAVAVACFLVLGTVIAATFVGAGLPFLVGGPLALASHAVLVFCEPHRRPITHTFRVACYACGPLVLGGIPIVGLVPGVPWALAALIVGLRAAHGTSTLVAGVAALWLPTLLAAALVMR